jgi:hypothetical protein
MDPVLDPLLLSKSGSAGNRTRTSGSVVKNSDHQTTEAVIYISDSYFIFVVLLFTLLIPSYMHRKLKSKLYYDRQSVGQSVLVSGTHLGPATSFSRF